VSLLIDVKVPSLPRSRPQTYKDDELERILAGIDRHHKHRALNLALVRLLLDGGLRLKEACELQPEDIDWESGRIHVRWQVTRRNKERHTMVGCRTLLELRRYLEDFRPRDAVTDNLFVDQDGGPLTRHAVQCVLSRLKRKLGLKKLSAHHFRRTWATNFRRAGVGDLFDLQLEGGWEDLSVRQRFYVDVEVAKAGRASVMDRWELERRKRGRAPSPAPTSVKKPVQAVQAREPQKTSRPPLGLPLAGPV
jgi:integrase